VFSFPCFFFLHHFLSFWGLLSLLHSFLRSLLLVFSIFSVPYHSRFLFLLYFCIRYLTIFSVPQLPYTIQRAQPYSGRLIKRDFQNAQCTLHCTVAFVKIRGMCFGRWKEKQFGRLAFISCCLRAVMSRYLTCLR
jgi:hypothetical protein